MIIIKTYVPSYFEKFNCIADKCPDTCCAGWEVNPDPESVQKYRSLNGKIGDKIRRHLTTDADGDYMFTLSENDRCPFLNKKNLCEMYIELGSDSLCKTCKLFPRFFDDFGAFREMGIGFGCPEAARLILAENEPVSIIEYGEENAESESVDEVFLEFLLELRKKLFTALNDSSLTFKDKIKNVLTLCESCQRKLDGEDFCGTNVKIDFSDCVSLLNKMEYIDEKRKNQLCSLSDENYNRKTVEEFSSDFEKLMKYYIYRYFLKAVFDYDLLTKVKYGIFACAVIARLYSTSENPSFDERVKFMYGYSKEVEYSDVNLDLLDEFLYHCDCDGLLLLF